MTATALGEHAIILARCVHGLEWVCADEIAANVTGATAVRLSRREVSFAVPRVDASLLGLRTVDDVFVRVGQVDDVATTKDAPPALARRVARLDFTRGLGRIRQARAVPARPQFDVVASLEGRRNYNRFAVENAAGAALQPVLGGSYLPRSHEGQRGGEPDLTVRIFLRHSTAVVALRLAGRPLHRRTYKMDTGPATLHPPLAAAMVRLVGATSSVLDPFCGDGTIAIEAALALPDALVVASDIDARRIANAAANAQRAGVGAALMRADAAEPPWRGGTVEAMVTNPPWSIAVDATGGLARGFEPLWTWLPRVLTERGRLCAIVDADVDVPGELSRAGYAAVLDTRIRLVGRVSQLLLCAPPGRPAPALPPSMLAWRRRAIAEGTVTDVGF